MYDNQKIAHELDRVMRKIDAQMHKRMPNLDTGRIGPMGGLLLMQLETMQPCSIQAIATAMGRDNSQLTRLIRNLEKVGVLRREQSLFDGREAVLSITESGAAFLTEAKTALIDVVGKILEPLDDCERQQLHVILGKI